jgi:DNA-directed RNA polymerase specialized sigma24 family protein
MKEPTRRDELYEQCLRRVRNYRTQYRRILSEWDEVKLAEEVTGIIRGTLARNPKRIKNIEEHDAQTCIPTKYVDDVIRFYQAEVSHVDRLKGSDKLLWMDLLRPTEAHVRRWLAGHYLPGYYAISFDHLVLEIVNQTFIRMMDSEFKSYYYDCPLNIWIRNFAYNVGRELLRDNICYQQKIQSLEAIVPGTDGIEVGDTLSNPVLQAQLDQVVARVVIEQALPALSPDQATVINSILAHKSIGEIACEMNRNPKAIYSLKERAVVRMRRYLMLSGEF